MFESLLRFFKFIPPAMIVGGDGRSPLWDKLRDEWIKHNGSCAACGGKTNLEAHHVVPFSVEPKLELDPGNLLTMCSTCHLVFGHLKNWKSWNPTVRFDAQQFLFRVKNRPFNKIIPKIAP